MTQALDERSASPDLAKALLPAVRRAIPNCSQVQDLRRLTGGANQETWSFDAVAREGRVPLILRRAAGGHLQRESGLGLDREARVVRAVSEAGVPVPKVVEILEADDGLGAGYVMRRVPGETIPRKILRDEAFADVRPRLAELCGRALAAIHAVSIETLPALPAFAPIERVEWLRGQVEATGQTSAVFSFAFAWLRENAPDPPQHNALVHGDFRNGNLMVTKTGIAAVLDWENAHLGDPIEDLGWFCVPSWRFGNIDKPAGGFGSREQLLEGYGEARELDPGRLRFWEAYGSLYWGMVCARSVAEFREGKDPSVERAMIARRKSETELDLLRLLAPRRGS